MAVDGEHPTDRRSRGSPVPRLVPSLSALAALALVAAVPAADPGASQLAGEDCRATSVVDEAGNETVVPLCESVQYVAAGTTPLSNATAAVFTAEEPTAPIGGAALGGSVTDIALQGDPAHGLEVTGTFTGALDSLDVIVHVAMPNAELGRHGVTPTLEVDGFDFGGQLLDATVTPGEGGFQQLHFRVDGMLELWPLLQFDPRPEAEHTLRLNLSPYYVGDDGAYLYGGTDVPSRVVLNAAG